MKAKFPFVTATQKKIELTDYQIDILNSMEKMETCDFAISISKDRTPGPHKLNISYNGSGFIRSLFKNKNL